ncbi:MAG TPA: SusC/RagA family TonB-linked outer membrane protein [Gemmatimonadaceae bacterium]|nr:SusC/RagA family TonB-linked outer membrane protein [Gemmatimonadaceae bacterium]
MRKFCAVVLVLLASAFFANDAAAQQRRITGRVTATGSGEPLSNVAVSVVGTTLGTYTGEDGSYQLLAPEGDVTLLVRRVGYKRANARVASGQGEANVALERDILQLETQVITGQTTNVARLNAANAVSQVSGEELNRAPTPTVENALQGKVAGATITQNSGAPGGGVQIRMRGVTSILGASDPLYVIDGVVVSNDVIQPGTNAVLAASGGSNASSQDNGVNRIADINPNDIENIEILKGASASAIYGSKASNGVVIITTKRGTSGRPRIEATQRLGTYSLANKLEMKRFSLADAYAFADDYGVDSATVLRNYNSCGGFCDIQEQLYGRKDLSYETTLSIQGGTEATKYFISGLAKHDGSIQNNAGYDKQSLRVNLSQLVGSKLTLDARANMVHSLTKRSLSNNDNVNVTPYFVIPSTPSFMDLRPVNGRYPQNPFTSSNPLETLDKVKTPEDVYRLIGSASATYSVFASQAQSLQLRLDGGIDHFSQTDNVFSPRDLQFEPADLLPGTATFQNGNNLTANVNLSATHQFFPASKLFTLTTSAGVQREFKDQKVANIVTRDVLGPNVQQGASVEAFDFRQQSRDLAFFGQEEVLALEERLLLTAAIRGQRSTVNGDVNKFYTFPKFAASYRLPTTFLPRIDEFKLRTAWGQAGNQPLFDSKFTPSLVGVYNGQVGVQVATRRGNPNVRPEKQTEIEGGVDITALDSRLSLTVTGYQKTITDMLLRPSLAPSTGFLSQDINAGELQNRGLEIELGATPVQYGDFTWVSRTTFARNRGKVISLPDIVGRVQCLNAAGTGIETTNQLRCPRGFTAGAFGFFYGQGRIQEGASPTQIVGQDTIPNGGGLTYLRKFGDTEPDYTMGFSNEFLWRGFRVYGLLDWRKGGKIVNLTESVFDDVGTNADQAGADRRHELGDLGISPYIEDASFVKLREISLAYEIPGDWTSRVTNGLARSLQIELAGRNLATWTKYNGLDPEVSNFGNQNIVRNQDLAPFPPSRSFFVSLNFGF